MIIQEAIASSIISQVTPKLEPVTKTILQYNTPPASVPIVPPTISGPVVQYPNKQLPPVVEQVTKVSLPETSLHSSPAREEGEVPESELDPDTRRRLLILQHGMDMREQAHSAPPQFPVRPPMPAGDPRVEPQPRGGWLPMGEEMGPRQLNRLAPPSKEFPVQSEPMHIEQNHPLHVPPPFVHKVEPRMLPDRVLENQRLPMEVKHGATAFYALC